VPRLVRAICGVQACRFKACWQLVVSVARVLDDTMSALPLSPTAHGRMLQVLADGYREDKDGLIYRDYNEGGGEMPSDGQEVPTLTRTLLQTICLRGCSHTATLGMPNDKSSAALCSDQDIPIGAGVLQRPLS
jgi:hypothetical protein